MADNSKNPLKQLDVTTVLLQNAKNGDAGSARYLLRHASRTIAAGEVLDKKTARWIADGLYALTLGDGNGKNAGTVFNLTKRGAKPRLGEDLELAVATFIHESSAGRHKGVSADGKTKGALTLAAEEFGIHENTAEKYYKKYEGYLKFCDKLKRDIDEHGSPL